jgi:hypothetical protein
MGKGHTATATQRRFTYASLLLLFLLLAPALGWGQSYGYTQYEDVSYTGIYKVTLNTPNTTANLEVSIVEGGILNLPAFLIFDFVKL